MKIYKLNIIKKGYLRVIRLLLLIPIFLLVMTRCELHDLPEMEPYMEKFDMTIMEWLPTHNDKNFGNDFTLLIQALEITGLNTLLSGTSEYTLFAPGNISWQLYMQSNGYSSLTEIPVNTLEGILRYNILSGKRLRQDFTPERTAYETILPGSFLNINYVDINPVGRYYTLIVNTRNVATQNIQFNNGVIHSYGVTGMERGSSGSAAAVRLLTP